MIRRAWSVHLRGLMRYSISFILLLLLAACGGEGVIVRGTLADGDDGTNRVWVVGGGIGSAVRDSSFEVTSDSAGTLSLRFADEDGDISRMVFEDVAAGADLLLSGVWIERGEGLAFPTTVSGDGDDLVVINGLRVAIGGAVSGDTDLQGTVLAASDDALVVRPADSAMGDVRVVVTPGTSVHSPDEDPGEVDDLEFGDSVQVRGMTVAGYVVATELVTPRRVDDGDRSAPQESASDGDDWVDALFGGGDDDGERGKSEDRGKSDDRRKSGNGKGKGKGNG